MKPSWHRRGLSEEGRVNVTPLIDVVMCLIVFYLMVGNLVLQRRGETDLPETTVGLTATRETDPIVITVHTDEILIDGVASARTRVSSVLAGRLEREPGMVVQVRADREVEFALVRPVLQACRDAGVERVELATRPAPGAMRNRAPGRQPAALPAPDAAEATR